MRGREQDSGETERESVLEAEHLWRDRDGVGNKIDCWRKTYGANVRLISSMIKNVTNYVVPMICIFYLLIYKLHFDLMKSCKSPIILSNMI